MAAQTTKMVDRVAKKELYKVLHLIVRIEMALYLTIITDG